MNREGKVKSTRHNEVGMEMKEGRQSIYNRESNTGDKNLGKG